MRLDLQGLSLEFEEFTVVSTYLSYDLLNRDMKSSLSRVASQNIVERQTNYYKENIGKVTSVDEFLDDYQLYSYAMDAFGLSEMIYAKAFMRQVLESDLNDENSFANKLTDERYRNFAEAFNFSTSTAAFQTEAQLDALIGTYSQTLQSQDDSLAEETRYFKAVMETVTNVDEVLQNPRLRSYVFKVFGVDEKTFSYSYIKGLMTSDLADPDSYINQQFGAGYVAAIEKLTTKSNIEMHAQVTTRITAIDALLADASTTPEKRTELETERVERQAQLGQLEAVLPPPADWEATLAAINAEAPKLRATVNQFNKMSLMADAFDFANDGTVAAGDAVSDVNLKAITNSYIGSSTRVTKTVADLNREYFESKIGTITTLDELMADSRMVSFIRTAFDLTGLTIVNATVENILTSDMSDPNNYITTIGKDNPNYIALREAFNFLSDGTLAAGTTPQTALQTTVTGSRYMSRYDDKDVENDEKALQAFKSASASVKSIDDFVGTGAIYTYALKAVGLDPSTTSVKTIREVLKSDLQDPNSFVYKQNDERYVKLAELFNFKSDGSLAAPLLPQSQLDIQSMSVAYIKSKSAFGNEQDREAAQKEAEHYASELQKIKTLDDLLKNTRVMEFAMEALRLDPTTVTNDDLRRIFTSDLDDPESFVNKNYHSDWRQLVTSFNFGPDGLMLREERDAIQTRRGFYEVIDNYVRQTMEVQAGEENAGVRLALYFQRMASGVTSYYTILADTALQEFINVTFGIPEEMANANVDAQVGMMEKYFDLEDLQDPEQVKKLIARFTVLYDGQNGASDPIMMLFDGSGGYGISGDTLLAASSYKLY